MNQKKGDDRGTFDVIVVGAGPAGAMAALHAAQGGCRVCLCERKEWVGVPVRCGEAVGFKGFTLTLPVEDRWILARVKKIRMISPSGHAVDISNPEKLGENYVLDRSVMDAELVSRAEKAGAVYFPKTPILSVSWNGSHRYTCRSTRESFVAPCVILADGVESRLARSLGWDTALAPADIESCAFCHVTHQAISGDTIDFYIGTEIAPGGFLWVFPRGNKTANVGLGVLGTFSTAGKARALLEDFITKKFPGATVDAMHCGGVPVSKWRKPLVKNGAMLVGDAACQVNALSGGGIAYALFAGRVAGETAAEAKKNDGFDYSVLRRYQKRWESYCGKQQLRSFALKSMLLEKNNDHFYDSIALELSKERPERLSYTRVFMRTFARHPGILLKTFLLFR